MKEFVDGNEAFSGAEKKVMMQFGAFMRDETKERGIDALATELTFDQKMILEENAAFIKLSLDLANVTFLGEGESAPDDKKKKDVPVPGKPVLQFYF